MEKADQITREHLQELANRTQGDNLPLICSGLLALLLIYCGRNYVLFGFGAPAWHLAITGAMVLVSVVLVALAVRHMIAPRFYQATGMLLVLFNGAATHINILAEMTAGIYTSALTVLALSLSVLSIRYFFTTLLLFIISWLAAVSVSQDISEWSSTLVLVLVASAVSFAIQRQRLNALKRVLTLESKVTELESFLSLCANCRKARDSEGLWMSLEEYLEINEGKIISHGICPDCKNELYGDVLNNKGNGGQQTV